MSILQEILHKLIETANAKPNEWQSTRLARGLTVHVLNDITAYKLFLSRTDTYPSQQEWDTVLKYWPYRTGGEFTQGTKDRRFFLKGRIPRQEAFA